MIPPNRLDRKPPRNAFAGLGTNVHTGNPMAHPTQRNLAGYGPGGAARAKNKLSTPTNRLGLPFRAIADGVNLIESICEALEGGESAKGGRVEAYGHQGMTSKPWRRVFPNQAAFEKWLAKDDGHTTIEGTRNPDA